MPSFDRGRRQLTAWAPCRHTSNHEERRGGDVGSSSASALRSSHCFRREAARRARARLERAPVASVGQRLSRRSRGAGGLLWRWIGKTLLRRGRSLIAIRRLANRHGGRSLIASVAPCHRSRRPPLAARSDARCGRLRPSGVREAEPSRPIANGGSCSVVSVRGVTTSTKSRMPSFLKSSSASL